VYKTSVIHRNVKNYFKDENNYYNSKPTCLIVHLDKKIKVLYENVIDN
jgi:hypothetical protein